MLVETTAEARNRMRDLRVERGFTHEQLAEMVGASRNTIGAVERGKHLPNVDLARRIARALGSDLNTVFGDIEAGSEPVEAAAP